MVLITFTIYYPALLQMNLSKVSLHQWEFICKRLFSQSMSVNAGECICALLRDVRASAVRAVFCAYFNPVPWLNVA